MSRLHVIRCRIHESHCLVIECKTDGLDTPHLDSPQVYGLTWGLARIDYSTLGPIPLDSPRVTQADSLLSPIGCLRVSGIGRIAI
jgi:hypothetical protein